jgi:hypothetical protein
MVSACQRWRLSTSTALAGMTSLEEEVRRQLTVNTTLRASLAAAEATVATLSVQTSADDQLQELRQAVKEGTSSERVKYDWMLGCFGCLVTWLVG